MRHGTLLRAAATAVLFTIISVSASPAQVVSVQTVEFDQADLRFDKVRGYDIVELKGCHFLTETGRPALPSKEIRVALPLGMAATSARLTSSHSEVVEGEYTILPAQPPRRVSLRSGQEDFVEPDPALYSSTELYPTEVVEFLYQTDLAGQGIAVVRVNPVQYLAAERKLLLHTSITFTIEGVGGYECGDYLPVSLSERPTKSYEKMIKGMVINPEAVEISVSQEPPSRMGVEPGYYEYVIITLSNWVEEFQPLAEWKTKKGVSATVVDTYWIRHHGGYGGSYVEQIRQFVIDTHTSWGAVHFLLAGDVAIIPAHIRQIQGSEVPNDTYYSDFDDDWTCEVHVGRASVRDTFEIRSFIDKVLTYEKNPPPTGYAKRAALFGFDLYEPESGEGENCKMDIDSLYLPSHWEVTTVYDSHGGNHKSYAIAAVNDGHHLLNHIDHCSEGSICTGYVNHGWSIVKADVDAFHNGDRQGIFYSIGCWPCAYDYPDCIAEHWVRNPNGGGVAFVGNSRYGYYNAYLDNTLSLLYDRYFFRSLFDQGHLVLGECFSDHKNDGPKTSYTYKYIFTELTLLGDPELPIWTEDPRSLEVTHPSTLPTGPSPFTVHVEDPARGEVGYAYVCLWKGEEIYMTGYTDVYGDITFNPSPTTTGTMYVTVKRYDYLPRESEAEVTSGGVVTLQCHCLTPVFCRGKNFYFQLTIVNSTGGSISGSLSFIGYSGHDCDPANELVRIPRQRSYPQGTSEESYFFKTPGTISPGPYSVSVSGVLSGWELSCCMDCDVIQCEPWRVSSSSEWQLAEVDAPEVPLPNVTALHQNYPNPFNCETSISYMLAEAGHVSLRMYDITGRLVATLVNERRGAGEHSATWDASQASSGVYFYVLRAGDFSEAKRMMLVK
jgi:hypothetical protein